MRGVGEREPLRVCDGELVLGGGDVTLALALAGSMNGRGEAGSPFGEASEAACSRNRERTAEIALCTVASTVPVWLLGLSLGTLMPPRAGLLLAWCAGERAAEEEGVTAAACSAA